MNVVGLGSVGCAVADCFSKFPQYSIYKIDTGLKGTNCFHVPRRKTHEEYEEKCPSFKAKFKKIEGPTVFILSGAGMIAGACLRLLEQLSHNPVTVLYIQPDIALLGETQTIQERIVYNVLQEYARSGMLERIYLMSNSKIQEGIGDLPIRGYYDTINQAIVNTFHMLNVFGHSAPVLGTFTEPAPISRISTMGVLDVEKNEEKWFFDLQIPRDVVYYYGISKEELETDGKLFKNITDFVKSNIDDNINVSYGVYETGYEQKYCYCVKHSSVVQSYIELLGDQGIG